MWLTAGLETEDCHTLLIAGTVPPGEEDMSYFATENGVQPLFIPEMSREISFKDALTIWKLYRLFCRERPDIVHTHTAKAGTVGRVAGFLYRWLTPSTLVGRPRQCRLVHTYHGHIFHSYYGVLKTRIFLLIEKLLARIGTDRIVVVSEQQRREINERFKVGRKPQFAVIPLGLDLGVYAEWQARRNRFREELMVTDDEILIGIVGRLTEIKNHDLFLTAVALMKEKTRTRVRFVVIGDGALRDNLETQAQSLKFGNDLIFAGNRKDPENFYPALDLVCLTSRNEGTPLTLIEAMANGRPVIATAVGGVGDLLGEVRSENGGYAICDRGVRVVPNDAESFATGLARLVEDHDLRHEVARQGLEFVHQNYAKERLLDDVGLLYCELLGGSTVPVMNRAAERSVESRV